MQRKITRFALAGKWGGRGDSGDPLGSRSAAEAIVESPAKAT
jgi:hypothetical protein